MNEMQIFKNAKFGEIRVIVRENEPWFIASDACRILDIANPSDALKRLDDDERARFNLGRQGEVNIVNEPGLYSLVLGSRKPEAKEFKRWLTHEVIPTIRKTGSYALPKQQSLEPLYTPAVRTYQGQRVVTIKDISLATKQPEGSITYWLNTKCRKVTDFILLRGAALQTFKSENGLQGYLASRLYVVFESGFRKLCKMLGILPEKTGCFPALPKEAETSAFTLDGHLQYADPESNPEIKSWIGHIRGHLDALDLLLYRYGDKHTAKAQEGLKYVLRDIGVDIVSSIHRLTKEKYALTTEY